MSIRYAHKVIILVAVIILLVICSVGLNASDANKDDIKQINLIIRSVYKEDAKKFFRFGIRESSKQRIAYYNKYFTSKAAKKMISDFAWNPGDTVDVHDPRFGDVIAPDEYDVEWYKYFNFTKQISTITFSNPIVNGPIAKVLVDSILKNGLTTNRTEYTFKKENNIWKIDNFSWGYKENHDGIINRGFTKLID